MRPVQRNLIKKSVLLLLLLFSTTSPMVAGQDVDIAASIKNNTCQNGISNSGSINLGVVGVGDFTRNISAENYHLGRREFTITVQGCTPQDTGSVLNQLYVNFHALNGVMTIDSSQIFADEDDAGTKNVGVIIFSIQDPVNTSSVLSATGSSCSVYPVTLLALNSSSWKFNTQMQKIDPVLDIASGPLVSHVLADIYYE